MSSTPVEHGIDPKIWGPPTWTSLYYILGGFDPHRQRIEDIQAYFDNLSKVLPCGTCANHFRDVMKYMNEYHPLAEYAKQDKLEDWFTIVREEVRKNEGKPYTPEGLSSSRWSPLLTTAVVIGSAAIGAGIGYYVYRKVYPTQNQ